MEHKHPEIAIFAAQKCLSLKPLVAMLPPDGLEVADFVIYLSATLGPQSLTQAIKEIAENAKLRAIDLTSLARIVFKQYKNQEGASELLQQSWKVCKEEVMNTGTCGHKSCKYDLLFHIQMKFTYLFQEMHQLL